MSTYSVEQLLTIWKQENMTAEQAVGHLLQHLALVYERVRVLERRLAAAATDRNKSAAEPANAHE